MAAEVDGALRRGDCHCGRVGGSSARRLRRSKIFCNVRYDALHASFATTGTGRSR